MKTIGTFLGIAFVAGLVFFGHQKYGDWQDAKLIRWKADSTTHADAARAAERDAILKRLAADTAGLRYATTRNRIITSGTATPRELEIFGKCDDVKQTCADQRSADSVSHAATKAELATARARPSERQKRLTLYGAALYDVLHAAPVFRAGTELRLLGGISSMAEGELAIPSAVQCQSGKCGVTMRALVGVRYVF